MNKYVSICKAIKLGYLKNTFVQRKIKFIETKSDEFDSVAKQSNFINGCH